MLGSLGEAREVGFGSAAEEVFQLGFLGGEGLDFGGEGFVFPLLFVGGAGFVGVGALVFRLFVARFQGLVAARGVLGCAVLGVVAGIVADVAVAFEDHEVVDDVVHETAIVADDDEASLIVAEEAFEDFERVDVEVVGGLVENQEVGVGHEHCEQVEPSALAATEVAEVVVLRHVVEAEVGEELVGGHLFAAVQLYLLRHVLDNLNDAAVGGGCHAGLGVEAEADGLPHDDAAAVGAQLLGDEVEEGGFPDAVGPHDAYLLALLEGVAVVVDQRDAVVAFGDVVHLQYFAANAFGLHRQLRTAFVETGMGFGFQLVEGVDTGLGLGATRLGHAAHPFQLGAIEAFGLLDLHALVVLAFGFLLQVVVVVAAIVVETAVVNLQYVLADVVEEVAVVCDHEDGEPLARQEILQPFNHFDVKMVGGLVQQQQVCVVDEYAAEGCFLLLASAEGVHCLVHLAVEVQPAEDFVNALLKGPFVLVLGPLH